MILIRRWLPLKKIYKIGVLNLTLILLYIALNLTYFGHRLYGLQILLPYNNYILLAVCLLIIYRLSNLNVEINYKFQKNEKTFTYFNQLDKRWKKTKYRNSTIGKTGCGLAVLAMIHSAVDKDINIEKVRDSIYEISNTREGLGTSTDSMVKYLNNNEIENNYISRNADLNLEMKDDNVICVWWKNMPKYINEIPLPGFRNCHYLLLYDIQGNKAFVADPANYARTRKPMRLDKLIKKVNRLPQGVTHPYISVRF
jgi:hypothetical protein